MLRDDPIKEQQKQMLKAMCQKGDPFSLLNAAASYRDLKTVGMDVVVEFLCENPKYAHYFLTRRPPRAITGTVISDVKNFRELFFQEDRDGIMWIEKLMLGGNKDIYNAVSDLDLLNSKHIPAKHSNDIAHLKAVLNIHLIPTKDFSLKMVDWTALEWLYKNPPLFKRFLQNSDPALIRSLFIEQGKPNSNELNDKTENLIRDKSPTEKQRITNLLFFYAFADKKQLEKPYVPKRRQLNKNDFPKEYAIPKNPALSFYNTLTSRIDPDKDKDLDKKEIVAKMVQFLYCIEDSDPELTKTYFTIFNQPIRQADPAALSYLVENMRYFINNPSANYIYGEYFFNKLFESELIADHFSNHVIAILRTLAKDSQSSYNELGLSWLNNPNFMRAMILSIRINLDEPGFIKDLFNSKLLRNAFILSMRAPDMKKTREKYSPLAALFEHLSAFDKPSGGLNSQYLNKDNYLYLVAIRKLKSYLEDKRIDTSIQNKYNDPALKKIIECPDDKDILSFLNERIALLEKDEATKQAANRTEAIANDPTAVNLLVYPDASVRKSLADNEMLVIGDLHANGLKLANILLRNNIIDMKKDDYEKLVDLYYLPPVLYDKKAEAEFQAILSRMTVTNPKAMINLIGDTLADRARYDHIVLGIRKRLHDLGIKPPAQPTNISNHDMEFLSAFKNIDDPIFSTALGGDQARSLENLHYLIHQGVIEKSDIQAIIDTVYKPSLKLITYEVTGDQSIAITSHAGIGLDTLQDLAETFGIPYQDGTVHELAAFIDKINQYVTDHFDELLIESRMFTDIGWFEQRKANPFTSVFWNRSYDQYLYRPEKHNGYQLTWRHGHDSSEKNRPKNVNCQDNTFGKVDENVLSSVENAGFVVVSRGDTLSLKKDASPRQTEWRVASPSLPQDDKKPSGPRKRSDAMDEDKGKGKEKASKPIDYADLLSKKKDALSESPKDQREKIYQEMIVLHDNLIQDPAYRQHTGTPSRRPDVQPLIDKINSEKSECLDEKRDKINPDKINKILFIRELLYKMQAYPDKSANEIVREMKNSLGFLALSRIYQASTKDVIEQFIKDDTKMRQHSATFFGSAGAQKPGDKSGSSPTSAPGQTKK